MQFKEVRGNISQKEVLPYRVILMNNGRALGSGSGASLALALGLDIGIVIGLALSPTLA